MLSLTSAAVLTFAQVLGCTTECQQHLSNKRQGIWPAGACLPADALDAAAAATAAGCCCSRLLQCVALGTHHGNAAIAKRSVAVFPQYKRMHAVCMPTRAEQHRSLRCQGVPQVLYCAQHGRRLLILRQYCTP